MISTTRVRNVGSGQLEQILGRELQRYRQEKGWSQEYLAEVTGY
ncbi:hypothetical protein [Microcystis aeruginosa]|nr:hypothetical protein [Microcystis aeruginosa]